MEIEKVGIQSIPIIRSLAYQIWAITYREILPAPQMAYMLNLIYSSESLQDQIEKLGHQFILATTDETPVGFASYGIKNEADEKIYNLHKIYVDPNQQGNGIGNMLVKYILDEIKPNGAKALDLNVNRQNKALGFYQKLGFKIIEQKDIPIGCGYFMNDYIMRLSF